MNVDTELELWRTEWQSSPALPLDLRAKVERQTRWMRFVLAMDILVTIVMGGGTAIWAIRAQELDVILLSLATWVFIAIAWIFAFRINSGSWSPAALNHAAFVDLLVKRCRGRLAALRFGAWFFTVEMTFCLGWVYQHSPGQTKPVLEWLCFSSLAIDLVWVISLAFFGFLIWFRRRKRAELEHLLRTQHSLS